MMKLEQKNFTKSLQMASENNKSKSEESGGAPYPMLPLCPAWPWASLTPYPNLTQITHFFLFLSPGGVSESISCCSDER